MYRKQWWGHSNGSFEYIGFVLFGWWSRKGRKKKTFVLNVLIEFHTWSVSMSILNYFSINNTKHVVYAYLNAKITFDVCVFLLLV